MIIPTFNVRQKHIQDVRVDYLIQTKFNTLYICEIKFSKEPIGLSVVKEVKQKMERIAKPKNFSIRPVLIHVNGVTDAVIESDFFAKIIDFGQFLEGQSDPKKPFSGDVITTKRQVRERHIRVKDSVTTTKGRLRGLQVGHLPGVRSCCLYIRQSLFETVFRPFLLKTLTLLDHRVAQSSSV